jgi:hypothetical protein
MRKNQLEANGNRAGSPFFDVAIIDGGITGFIKFPDEEGTETM